MNTTKLREVVELLLMAAAEQQRAENARLRNAYGAKVSELAAANQELERVCALLKEAIYGRTQ